MLWQTSVRLVLTLSSFFFFFSFIQEPSNKRVKPLSRVTSLANLIPPVKTTPLKRFSQTLQVRERGLGLGLAESHAVLMHLASLWVSSGAESPLATVEECTGEGE